MATTPVDAITTVAATLSGYVLPIGVVGLGVGATIFGLKFGWRLLRSFAK